MRLAIVLLVSTLTSLLTTAQGQNTALREQSRELSVMLRTQPPDMTLRTVDSILSDPIHGIEPAWRMEMAGYRGHALRLLGRLDEAMEEQIRSYQLADSLMDREGVVNAMLALSNIYMDLNDVERAGRELRKAFAMNEERTIDRPYRIPLVLSAWCDFREMPDSSLYWGEMALPMAEAARDSFVMADILFNRGLSLGATGRSEECERSLQRALQVVPTGGYPHLEARVREMLAFLYLEQGRLEEIPPQLDRAEHLAIAYGGGELLTIVIGDRIEYHLARKDSASALRQVDRLMAVKDSLSGTLRAKALAASQARFGVSRLEKELSLTRAASEVDRLRAQRAWLAWGAVAFIVVMAAGLVRSFRRQTQLKQKAAHLLSREKERLMEENELLHQENLMARFETLKSQIDPHFLFNAMNTLYALVETEPAKAREFIASFSALYRQVLGSRERTIVPVREELDLVRHYLFLQRIRFGDALVVDVDVPVAQLGAFLPPFTLQMLLENAIKHNAVSAGRPLRITVEVEGRHLVVRNDLRPRGGASPSTGTGTGLENIRRRYAMLGAEEPTFRIEGDRYEARVPLLNELA